MLVVRISLNHLMRRLAARRVYLNTTHAFGRARYIYRFLTVVRGLTLTELENSDTSLRPLGRRRCELESNSFAGQ